MIINLYYISSTVEHDNPLDEGTDDVEIMDRSDANGDSSNSFWDEMDKIRSQLEKQIQKMINGDDDENKVKEDRIMSDSESVHGFDYGSEVPRVSTGLYASKEAFCSQKRENM